MGGLRDVMKRGNGTPRPRYMSEKTKEHLIEHEFGRPEGRTSTDGNPEGAPKGKATPENRAATRSQAPRARTAASEAVPRPKAKPAVEAAGRVDEREADRAAQRKYGQTDTLYARPVNPSAPRVPRVAGAQIPVDQVAADTVRPTRISRYKASPATLVRDGGETRVVPTLVPRSAGRRAAAARAPASLAEAVASEVDAAVRERAADTRTNRKERRKRKRKVVAPRRYRYSPSPEFE